MIFYSSIAANKSPLKYKGIILLHNDVWLSPDWFSSIAPIYESLYDNIWALNLPICQITSSDFPYDIYGKCNDYDEVINRLNYLVVNYGVEPPGCMNIVGTFPEVFGAFVIFRPDIYLEYVRRMGFGTFFMSEMVMLDIGIRKRLWNLSANNKPVIHLLGRDTYRFNLFRQSNTPGTVEVYDKWFETYGYCMDCFAFAWKFGICRKCAAEISDCASTSNWKDIDYHFDHITRIITDKNCDTCDVKDTCYYPGIVNQARIWGHENDEYIGE